MEMCENIGWKWCSLEYVSYVCAEEGFSPAKCNRKCAGLGQKYVYDILISVVYF